MVEWTTKETKLLLELYPTTPTNELCNMFNKPKGNIYGKAKQLNIKKTEKYLREQRKTTQINYLKTHKHQRCGKNMSDKSKRKISKANKNKIAWNKGMDKIELEKHYKAGWNLPDNGRGKNNIFWIPRITLICKQCKKQYEQKKRLLNTSKFCSMKCLRKYNETRFRDSGNPNWKGGKTPVIERLRNTTEYIQWVNTLLKRDNYTCQFCGKQNVRLCAHHIKLFSSNPEVRYNTTNGIILCSSCHPSNHNKPNNKELFESRCNDILNERGIINGN